MGYSDIIKVTNYKNGSVSLKQFYQVALQYIDTIKADKPVNEIYFIGEKAGYTLPTVNNDDQDQFFERRRNYIIQFQFQRTYRNDTSNISLYGVTFWKNGTEVIMYYNNNTKRFIDSILNSNQFYNPNTELKSPSHNTSYK